MNSAQKWSLSYKRHFMSHALLNPHIKPHFSLYSFSPETAALKTTKHSPFFSCYPTDSQFTRHGTAPSLSTESVPCLVAQAWGSAREPESFNQDTFHTTLMIKQRKSLAQAAESAWAQLDAEEHREPDTGRAQSCRGLRSSLHLHCTNTLNFLPPAVLLLPEL